MHLANDLKSITKGNYKKKSAYEMFCKLNSSMLAQQSNLQTKAWKDQPYKRNPKE